MFNLNVKTFTDFHEKTYASCLMEEIMSVALFVCMVYALKREIVTTRPVSPTILSSTPLLSFSC